MRAINTAGLSLIKKWEGVLDGDPSTVNLDPYLDPAGIWTIGWGHAVCDATGKFLRGVSRKADAFALYPDGLTTMQADDFLRADCLEAAKDVSALVTVPLTENQFSALVSFEFNTGALGKSTLLKKLNLGDVAGAADEFGKWVRSGRKVLAGLVRRRADERALFLA